MSSADEEKVAFARWLRVSLDARGVNQARLAEHLGVGANQVSNWAKGTHFPRRITIEQIENFLGQIFLAGSGENAVLKAPANVETRLYVASPILAIDPELLIQHHDDVALVVAAASEHADHVYWPGRGIRSSSQLKGPKQSTKDNLPEMLRADAFLYVQMTELRGPSGALIELGIALGLGINTTIIIRDGVRVPFMLQQGFESVVEHTPRLPDAEIHFPASAKEIADRISQSTAIFFGLPLRDPSPRDGELF